MRNRIKKIFSYKIIRIITLIIFIPIISYILKLFLDNGRIIGTIIRKLLNN